MRPRRSRTATPVLLTTGGVMMGMRTPRFVRRVAPFVVRRGLVFLSACSFALTLPLALGPRSAICAGWLKRLSAASRFRHADRQKGPEHDQETVARQPDESWPRIEGSVPHGARLERRVGAVLEDRRAHQQPDYA